MKELRVFGTNPIKTANNQGKSDEPVFRKKNLSSQAQLLARSLVKPHHTENLHRQTADGNPIPDDGDIAKLFKVATSNVRDATNIMKMSPELCMGIDIYIAGLLSPNDSSAPDLKISSNLTNELISVKSQLVEVVAEWAKNEYQIDSRLKDWVFKAKYLQGAVPLAVIPLTAIDSIINQNPEDKKRLAQESYDSSKENKKHLELLGINSKGNYNSTGILGKGLCGANPSKRKTVLSILAMESEDQDSLPIDSQIIVPQNYKLAMESAIDNFPNGSLAEKKTIKEQTIKAIENVYIHDNVEILKMPKIAAAMAKKKIQRKYSPLYSMAMEEDDGIVEANGKVVKIGEGELVYPDRNFDMKELITLRPSDIYENVGHPIPTEIPYDSVFPITANGAPQSPIGFLVAIDSTGSFLSATESETLSMDSGDIGMQTSTGIMGTQLLSQMGDNSVDGMSNLRFNSLNNASNRLFNSFLTADINERLKNGFYSGVELNVKFTEIFLTKMWRRAMQGMQVQFVFIPNELMSYIAFEFNELGLGESKLIKHRDVAIVASMLQISAALNAINNSIQHKKATITFDEDILDAQDTDEKIKQFLVRGQWANTMFSSTNTQDQLNQILNSGWNFSYENGNGAFPDTKIDIEYLTREAGQSDNEYLDSVNKRLIMLSGVSPEIVDMSQEVEFAQTYITGHMLRAQQAAIEQAILCKGIDRFIKNFCMNSKIIIDKLVEIVKKGLIDLKSPDANKGWKIRQMVEEFIESIVTSLPKPDTTKLEAQKTNIDTHEQFIDKVLTYYFDDPMLESDEIGEGLGGKADLYKAIYKAAYMRDVLQSNSLVPRQFMQLHGNVDDDDMVDPFQESEVLLNNFVKLALQHESQITKMASRADKVVENIKVKAGETDGGNDNSDTSNSDTGTDGSNGGGSDTNNPGDPNADSSQPADNSDDLFNDDNSSNPLG